MIDASSELEFFDEDLWCEPIRSFGIATLKAPKINENIEKAVEQLENIVEEVLKQKKFPFTFGGEHSITAGTIRPFARRYKNLAVLHFDAHADLRVAYEGLEYSHASIMYNALKRHSVQKLVQVGIRDYCQAELEIINNSNGRVKTFFDRDIKQQQYKGKSWDTICQEIIAELPQNIYLSFDIDGLDPKLCPNTGTPVAGGFETEQILFLIEKIVKSGRKIIAFDINEVSPGADGDDWDANVAARLLFRIANLAAMSKSN
jgi:agmatinase